MSAQQEQTALTLARGLAERELAVLRALFDYKVLFTSQVAILFYRSLRRAQDKLQEMSELRLIERDQNSSQWFIRENGVRVVAVLMRKARSQIDWMPRHSWYHDGNPMDHMLGVNRFFVSLVEMSLQNDGQGLHTWTPERFVRTRSAWIKHDGFGRYLHSQGDCDFYLEFDRATEHRAQLAKKLYGYLALADYWTEDGSGQIPNLLVVVPTETRERAFDRALVTALERFELRRAKIAELPFFVTSDSFIEERGILGQVWRRLTPTEDPPLILKERISLVELPAKDASPYHLVDCFSRKFREDGRACRKPAKYRPTYPSGSSQRWVP